jgi:hypothetical protein
VLSTNSLVLNTPVNAPGAVSDTVTVSGEADMAGHYIYVHLYKESNPPTPDAGSLATWEVMGTLDSHGNYTATTPPYIPESAGTFCFQASFTGDSEDTPVSTTVCEVLTVNKFQSSLTTAPSPITTAGGATTLSDTADLTIYPTKPAEGGSGDYGAVVFTLYSHADCTAPVPGGVTSPAGIAYTGTAFEATGSLSFSPPLAAATYYWSAFYPGNYDNLSSQSNCGSEPVTVPGGGEGGASATTITTNLSSGSSTVGGSVTDTATLTAGSGATGTITISMFSGSTSTACSGTAIASATASPATHGSGGYTATFSSLAAGSYEFQASYAGDSANLSSQSTCGSEPLMVTGGGELAASTTTPTTGAELASNGLAGAIAMFFGGLLLIVGRRVRRARTD